jgi:5'-AMP-activated protein kinase, catalytic alpha subunit
VASHVVTNTKVAIKIMRKQLAQEKGLLKNISYEAYFLRKFSHQHIVKLYPLSRFDYIKTETVIYLILEYVPGGELYTLLEKRGKLSENEARRYFYQVLTAVEYSHNQGVAHRDIKPENILLDEDKNIKLGDFGFSKTMRDGIFLKTSCGSANYAAPEIVSGQKYAGNEADTWSLGVLLYALLAGCLPFDEVSMPALISKIKEGSYSIPYHFSEQASDLVRRILVANPLFRISIADIFRHPWISGSFNTHPAPICVEIEVDEEIFRQLLENPRLANGESEEERKYKIVNQDGYDLFTVSYEMLAHEKFKRTGRRPEFVPRVFRPIRIYRNVGEMPFDWRCCFVMDDSIENTMVRLCDGLICLGSFWKHLTPFHLKVQHRTDIKKNLRIVVEVKVYEVRKI